MILRNISCNNDSMECYSNCSCFHRIDIFDIEDRGKCYNTAKDVQLSRCRAGGKTWTYEDLTACKQGPWMLEHVNVTRLVDGAEKWKLSCKVYPVNRCDTLRFCYRDWTAVNCRKAAVNWGK